MAASLFSGYSISGIANEAYTFGFAAIRWIPAGVALYAAFMIMAPRMHALGKSRGYLTLGELIYDRFSEPACSPIIPHTLRLVSLFCLQLPVFCYLITQFSSVAVEVRSLFADSWIGRYPAIIVASCVLLVCGLLGGLRAVAYNDVLQGFILLIGSLVFFVIQQEDLGGMSGVKEFVTSPSFQKSNPFGYKQFNYVPAAEGSWSTSSFATFIIKVMIAATMYPHLAMRLYVARDSRSMKIGLAGMNFTFFIVQFSSMVTGWVAVKALAGSPKTYSTFGSIAAIVRNKGAGGEFASALLVTAAVCAMLSTADSALIAFSTMWLRDFYLPYIKPTASQFSQVVFTKVMGVFGLALGVFLACMSVRSAQPWNLSNLFSLQTVTPIHVAPAVWLGLHWKGLRGEPVLLGMIVGLAVTFGFTFSSLNVKLSLGQEEIKSGWSPSLVGLCFNLIVTVGGGLLLEKYPNLLKTGELAQFARPMDIHKLFGEKMDPMINPVMWLVLSIIIAFIVPFYRDMGSPDYFVGSMTAWAFTSLMITGLLTLATAFCYVRFWKDYDLPKEPRLYHFDGDESQYDKEAPKDSDPSGGFAPQPMMQVFPPSSPSGVAQPMYSPGPFVNSASTPVASFQPVYPSVMTPVPSYPSIGSA
ncbi:hypothetical protein GUITHDRAFT_94455 [Guillardia theta CCMP2712]|uniref:Sodium/solute symporter n=1 Tax=Guillardia theta (strain CCMP2712) TaxID=905079 RepID=L1JBT9_GUITC|nr:hypothetical protein GUITHDRAFT_94455 [Guillardia theta CCMP2712]EKX46008.1 hypothetical protein GUITHDRAFT_94455 [Guillardia theta CCMP2712]|eukprot:XP_005832988.1 hypothetical protein GUITHDRAFT_94455 [Guillardia theta CCMP2712]